MLLNFLSIDLGQNNMGQWKLILQVPGVQQDMLGIETVACYIHNIAGQHDTHGRCSSSH